MKKHSFILLLCLSFLLAFIPKIFFNNKYEAGTEAEADGDENPADRYRWFVGRSADPLTGELPENIREREIAFVKTIPTREEYYGSSARYKMSNWQQRGPYNIGGRTRAFAVDVTNENTLLSGGATGGMWRSTDGGKSWSRSTDMQTLLSTSCVTQDVRAGKENIWYYGTGEYFGGHVISGDGIFKSTDSGKSWKHILAYNKPQSANNNNYIWSIITNKFNTIQDEVWFAARGGIWKSTLGGDSFKLVLTGQNSFGETANATDITQNSKGVFYATLSSECQKSQRGIWRSPDGKTWTNITPVNFPGTYTRIVLNCAPSNENVVYFLANTPGAGKKGKGWNNDAKYDDWNSLWKYTYVKGDGKDSNGKWENLSANIPVWHQSTPYIFGDFQTQHAYDMLVRVKPDDENVVFIGGTNLFRSDDGFTTPDKTYWVGGYSRAKKIEEDYTYSNHHPDQHSVFFSLTNTKVLYSSNDGGVFRTDNCLDTQIIWASLNNGYNCTQFYAANMNMNPTGGWKFNDLIVGGMQDNSTYAVDFNQPENTPWQKISRGDGGFCAVTNNDTVTNIYSSLQLGKVFKNSYDKNGNHMGWARIDPIGLPKMAIFIPPMLVDPNYKNRLYMAGDRAIWRNDSLEYIPLLGKDDSIYTGWTKIQQTVDNNDYISALSCSEKPADILYYGTYFGEVYMLKNASTKSAVRKRITPPASVAGSSGRTYNCIAIDPENAAVIIAVASNYNVRSLFLSRDSGTTWQNISGNLEEKPNGSGAGPACRWVKIIHNGTDTVFLCGTSAGLFFTNSLKGNNTLWMREGSGIIGNADVEMIHYRSLDGTILIATYGSGVFTGNISSLVGIKIVNIYSQELKLNVYPNPSDERIKFNFTLIKKENVSCYIYNLNGNEVYYSLYEKLSEGKHEREINISSLPEGTYILVIREGSKSRSAKFMVKH